MLGAVLVFGASAVAQVLQATTVQGFDAPAFYRRAWLEPPTLAVLVLTLASAGVGIGASIWSLLQSRVRSKTPRALAAMPSAGLRDLLTEIGARCLEAVAGAEPDVSLCIDEILRGALLLEASDIHISPSSQELSVTYRVHGALHDVVKLPASLGPRMAIRVKVLAQMDTYARRPLDGRLRHKLGDLPIEARVSSLPADFGERLVLRLVRGSATVPSVQQLGLDADVEKRLLELLSRPQGLLFVSGPVGSGKTTSLYASLGHIVESRGNVTSLVTLEDPIELQLPFATQTQINTHMGMSFAQTLRSVLRQDPNVLMVGEIRDRETAEIAMQAGLTGHLILTTIHVESAAGTFARMIDMGIDPYTVASATVGCVSQRLVRVLCTHCRKAQEPDALTLERFARLEVELPAVTYYEAAGCEFCEGQGFLGRQPLAEILIMSDKLRQAVHDRRPTAEITTLARQEGMVPLLAAALARAAEGTTTLSEVLRVAG
jgi:general secretion pathway protein E